MVLVDGGLPALLPDRDGAGQQQREGAAHLPGGRGGDLLRDDPGRYDEGMNSDAFTSGWEPTTCLFV